MLGFIAVAAWASRYLISGIQPCTLRTMQKHYQNFAKTAGMLLTVCLLVVSLRVLAGVERQERLDTIGNVQAESKFPALYRVNGLPWAVPGDEGLESYAALVPVWNSRHQSVPEPRSLQTLTIPDYIETGGKNEINASMFYWFFPCVNTSIPEPPLLIWLQGGPGASSMIGLFYENGPVKITPELKLERNPYAWNQKASLLFVDSPVGTGFSFVNPSPKAADPLRTPLAELYARANQTQGGCNEANYIDEPPKWGDGYAENQGAVAHDLVTFIHRFYEMYPEQRTRPLYLTGESYAGKYVPGLAYRIHNLNQKANQTRHIPLAGIAIGDGFTDPITQVMSHATQALALGLVSRADSEKMARLANLSVAFMCQNNLMEALDARMYMFDVFNNASGHINAYDVRKSFSYNRTLMNLFLAQESTTKALNLPAFVTFKKDENVFAHLALDVMRSARQYLPPLLNAGYQVLLYQGQFDFRDGVLGSTDYIDNISWDHSTQYNSAPREVWRVRPQGTVDGYVTRAANLVRVEVSNAGHLAPGDQPEVTLRMIEKFLLRD